MVLSAWFWSKHAVVVVVVSPIAFILSCCQLRIHILYLLVRPFDVLFVERIASTVQFSCNFTHACATIKVWVPSLIPKFRATISVRAHMHKSVKVSLAGFLENASNDGLSLGAILDNKWFIVVIFGIFVKHPRLRNHIVFLKSCLSSRQISLMGIHAYIARTRLAQRVADFVLLLFNSKVGLIVDYLPRLAISRVSPTFAIIFVIPRLIWVFWGRGGCNSWPKRYFTLILFLLCICISSVDWWLLATFKTALGSCKELISVNKWSAGLIRHRIRRDLVSLVLINYLVCLPILETDATWLIFALLIVDFYGWVGPVALLIVWHIDAGRLVGVFAYVAEVLGDDVNIVAWLFRFLLHLI